jgi:hypothetical protein
MNKKAPVLFVIFNRPDTTERVFAAIREYQPDKLYIAADGPREGRENEAQLCSATRAIVNEVDWDCEVKTLFKDKNVGCGIGVSSAITWLFEHEEYGIIVEDDCLPDTSFFPYCEELLVRYKEDTTVFQISGTNLQNGIGRGDGSYYFSHFSGIWGWATWRRAWATFTFDLGDVDEMFESGKLDHVFQSKAEKSFWFKKLKKESLKSVYDTWDYQWLYNEWKHKGMGIAPNLNLIANIGFDTTSTHTFLKDSLRDPQVNGSIEFPLYHPSKKIDSYADRYIYMNVYSRSIIRYRRLLRENGILGCLKYMFFKLVKK